MELKDLLSAYAEKYNKPYDAVNLEFRIIITEMMNLQLEPLQNETAATLIRGMNDAFSKACHPAGQMKEEKRGDNGGREYLTKRVQEMITARVLRLAEQIIEEDLELGGTIRRKCVKGPDLRDVIIEELINKYAEEGTPKQR